ncbi:MULTISPECIES: carboxymuconolactone decarboxylase family protein [Paenibacillus]|nr:MULTISPECIES: carboxymuconolactone decarboxylase family protein [Paenibacillus]MBD8836911.1 carboxymuconolactone decarboxylase family protein [Paenibacillus sp. CFBP 13594]MCF7754024.1 carboxymuconolactone decarboxylase family protein [Paenibacillus xylanexedens]OMF04719.1 alkylhydroperoxidase [Paenibacillus amylolyticus]PRA07831.1 alkylhydroperoxidase [Paenibacillus sp. MYb63]PRA51475.1 alkylhydroperoxidase [Paenibacillus sp. MYb67]
MSHQDSLFKKSNFKRIGEFNSVSPEIFKAFISFEKLALAEGKLTAKFKEIIAIAIAHTTGCPYCIEAHVKQAKKNGVSKEEMAESIMVATALKAGSAMAHGVNALNAYDGNDDDELYRASYINRLREFTQLSDSFKAFGSFDQQALKAGTLSTKEKELIAVAVAHTTGCPYCIDIHTKAAKKAGATKEELAESIMVATALKAGSALAHGVNALVAFDE